MSKRKGRKSIWCTGNAVPSSCSECNQDKGKPLYMVLGRVVPCTPVKVPSYTTWHLH